MLTRLPPSRPLRTPDFVMVENSEGSHNPDLTFETLDKAEAAADQALSMLA